MSEISNITTMSSMANDNNPNIKEEGVEVESPLADVKEESPADDVKVVSAEPKLEIDPEDIKMKLEPTITQELNIKDEVLTDDSDSDTQAEPQGSSSTKRVSNEAIDWPEPDLNTLIKRMEEAIPEKDTMAFSTRVEKLHWDAVAFEGHSADECKKTWLLIQKRVRRFRLLTELLQDAKEWVSKPWTDYYRRKKTKNCPDMPRRPLSVYMLFYLKMKDEIVAKTPDSDMTEVTKEISQIYKNLTPKEREQYVSMARGEKKLYEQKLDEFYRMHPEIPRQLEKPIKMKAKRPSTPFGLYYKEQLKTSSNRDNIAYKEECKKQYKILLDKEKIVWINLAVESESKYQNELKEYLVKNPNFQPPPLKPTLTKGERLLRERLSGKPVKPPTSAYSLFTAMMLQSQEIKKIAPKERLKAVAEEWKNSTDEEKKPFQKRVDEMMKRYKKELAAYLKSDNKEEEPPQAPKRKYKDRKLKNVPTKKKKPNNKESDSEKISNPEPPQPPISGFSLFSSTYKGLTPAKTAWKNLPRVEKAEFENKVKKMKQTYIKEYEKYLKSLSKQELLAFAQRKHQKNGADEPNGNDDKVENSSNSSASDTEDE